MEPSSSPVFPPASPSGPIAGASLSPPRPRVQPHVTPRPSQPTPARQPVLPLAPRAVAPAPRPVTPPLPTTPSPEMSNDVIKAPRLNITPPVPTAPLFMPEATGPSGNTDAQLVVGFGDDMSAPAANIDPVPTGDGSRKRVVMLSLIGAVVVIILVAGIFMALKILGGSVKYGARDLVTAQTSGYSINYPKEWKDSSSNQKLLASFGASGGLYSNLKIYTNKLNSNSTWAQSILLAADTSDGVNDSTISQNASLQKQLATTLQLGIDQSGNDMGCKSSTDKQDHAAYNTPNFVVYGSISFNCVRQDGDDHVIVQMGIKNSKVIFTVFSTAMKDWNLNSSLYTKDVIGSLKAT